MLISSGIRSLKNYSHNATPFETVTPVLFPAGAGEPPLDPQLPLYLRIWVTLVVAVLLVVGVVGNALVPVLIWRSRDLRHSTNILLFNLALADLLVLLVCLPTTLVDLHSRPETWVMGPALCRLIPFVEMGVEHASVLTLVIISVERYVAICKPLSNPALCTRPRAAVISLTLWIVAALTTSPVVAMTDYTTADYVDGSVVQVCVVSMEKSWMESYLWASMVLFSMIPLAFLGTVYTVISKQLLNPTVTNKRRLDSPHWKARKQVVFMLVAVVVVFFFCTIPYHILVAWQILSTKEEIISFGMEPYYNVYYATRVLLYVNSTANPIIYNAMSSKFRRALCRLFGLSGAYKKPLLRRQSTIITSLSSTSSFKRKASQILGRRSSDSSLTRGSSNRRNSDQLPSSARPKDSAAPAHNNASEDSSRRTSDASRKTSDTSCRKISGSSRKCSGNCGSDEVGLDAASKDVKVANDDCHKKAVTFSLNNSRIRAEDAEESVLASRNVLQFPSEGGSSTAGEAERGEVFHREHNQEGRSFVRPVSYRRAQECSDEISNSASKPKEIILDKITVL